MTNLLMDLVRMKELRTIGIPKSHTNTVKLTIDSTTEILLDVMVEGLCDISKSGYSPFIRQQ